MSPVENNTDSGMDQKGAIRKTLRMYKHYFEEYIRRIDENDDGEQRNEESDDNIDEIESDYDA